jgi:hypothetical protein
MPYGIAGFLFLKRRLQSEIHHFGNKSGNKILKIASFKQPIVIYDLREVIGKKAKANEILEFAKMIRVDKVMLPYIEAMV